MDEIGVAEPQFPKAVMVKEKLEFVARNNRRTAAACDRISAIIDEHPELGEDFVTVFGVTPVPE